MLATIAEDIHQSPINAETPLVVLRDRGNAAVADAGDTHVERDLFLRFGRR
jgi:hypothetical protein